eukprot:GHVT01007136.1.p1 GENE.GHVT01007136.1~~GHVT01007136.1.p1  ORF type:complete len:330 (+),score=27.30 GHVT01007136.1:2328-3317(+)
MGWTKFSNHGLDRARARATSAASLVKRRPSSGRWNDFPLAGVPVCFALTMLGVAALAAVLNLPTRVGPENVAGGVTAPSTSPLPRTGRQQLASTAARFAPAVATREGGYSAGKKLPVGPNESVALAARAKGGSVDLLQCVRLEAAKTHSTPAGLTMEKRRLSHSLSARYCQQLLREAAITTVVLMLSSGAAWANVTYKKLKTWKSGAYDMALFQSNKWLVRVLQSNNFTLVDSTRSAKLPHTHSYANYSIDQWPCALIKSINRTFVSSEIVPCDYNAPENAAKAAMCAVASVVVLAIVMAVCLQFWRSHSKRENKVDLDQTGLPLSHLT